MKFKFLIAFALVSVLSSCSSDDNSGSGGNDDNNPPPPVVTNYLPLKTGNYWTYRVERPDLS